jgi:hypothetical protein
MSLYLSLHKESFYKDKKNPEFPIRLNYYYKGSKVGFKTGVSVKERNWVDGESENPIKPSDSEYVSKNNRLRGLKREVDRILHLYSKKHFSVNPSFFGANFGANKKAATRQNS